MAIPVRVSMSDKGAYTGISASVIYGKTHHVLNHIPISGRESGPQTVKRLAAFWKGTRYVIIEKSTEAPPLLARLLKNICKGLLLAGGLNLPFGGLNVNLVGDFHQFSFSLAPSKDLPLYYPCNINVAVNTADEMLGRSILNVYHVRMHQPHLRPGDRVNTR
ncbi:hypothetical protein BS17DRAFT_785430 [Gyrodon lividus]|nr:hypothetical protein BS17DRAFT_785430 [Gyrodon lividus]